MLWSFTVGGEILPELYWREAVDASSRARAHTALRLHGTRPLRATGDAIFHSDSLTHLD